MILSFLKFFLYVCSGVTEVFYAFCQLDLYMESHDDFQKLISIFYFYFVKNKIK